VKPFDAVRERGFGPVGWVAPVPSTARTINVTVPMMVGTHSTAHSTHVWLPIAGLTRAGRHACPPSVLTSTARIPRSPPKATPATQFADPRVSVAPELGTSIRENVL
jgi:hypothetical protein